MVRRLYGARVADVVIVPSSQGFMVPTPGACGTLWTAQTGGTQITDLLDSNGNPISYLQQNMGYIPQFSGPDSSGPNGSYWDATLWADFGAIRVRVNPQPPVQADTGWTSLTLPTGWVTLSGWVVPQYRVRQDGWVNLRGFMQNQTGATVAAGATLFTLPVTPVLSEWYYTHVPTVAAADIQVDPTGVVTCDAPIPNTQNLTLSGIRFVTSSLNT